MKYPSQTREAHITHLSHDGRGIAHVDGKTTFIENALPDETVIFKYKKQHRRFDEGCVLEILKKSPQRVEPKCQAYTICGGCSLQHLDSTSQISHKQNALAEQLKHIGQVEPQRWLEPISGPIWGYRHKARIGVRYVEKKSQLLIGFRERNNPRLITDMNRCEILHPTVGYQIENIKALIESLDNMHEIPQIEVAIGDNATALIIRHLKIFNDSDLNKLKQFAATHNFHLYLQPGDLHSIHRIWPENGDDLLTYHLADEGVNLQFHPSQFTQINPEINRQMIQMARKLLDVKATDHVLDLFCGLGNFTLPIAKHCRSIIGIEGDTALVERAKQNAQNNQIQNAQFFTADLFQPLKKDLFDFSRTNKILLDPPRLGAKEICEVIHDFNPERIVYVSCDPATLSRDAGILVNKKHYQLSCVGVIDQFPHTRHVEAIALFEPKQKKRNHGKNQRKSSTHFA